MRSVHAYAADCSNETVLLCEQRASAKQTQTSRPTTADGSNGSAKQRRNTPHYSQELTQFLAIQTRFHRRKSASTGP
eukprot:1443829-Pleurochrysis_carterae.AAC.2